MTTFEARDFTKTFIWKYNFFSSVLIFCSFLLGIFKFRLFAFGLSLLFLILTSLISVNKKLKEGALFVAW